jgi:hypothetical protein
VPWALWATPLSAWAAFMLALFLCSLCIIVLLQRQWITHERLAFPLAQVPLEMVSESRRGELGERPGLPSAWPFWIGVAVSAGLTLVNELARRWPSIPAVPLGPLPLMREQRVGPLGGIGEITLVLWPWMIAIAYLIPKELSFSAWFFWWVLVGVNILAVMGGTEPRGPAYIWDSTFPAPRYQGGGAVLLIGLWAVWIARKHLTHILRTVFAGRAGDTDAREPMPYRLALIGLVLSLGGMVYFCWVAGCRLIVALSLVIGVVGYCVVWGRLRAETGLGFTSYPLQVFAIMRVPFGNAAFRIPEFVTANSLRWAYAKGGGTVFEVCTGNALETMKIADSSGIHKRRLTGALLLGFLLAAPLAIIVFLIGIHHYGWSELQGPNMRMAGIITDGNRIFAYITDPTETDVNGVAAMGIGAAVTALLGVMRLRFWWWPFHPIGYMAAMSFGLYLFWAPFLIGWACKTLVLRYGGLRLYRSTIPLAIGFIVGDLLNRGVWAAVALVTMGRV